MASRQRVLALDGLRALAILPVMALHFTPFNGPLSVLAPFTRAGWVGVEIFFVLSGFLITGILLDTVGQPGYYSGFVARRAVRIFPLYFLAVAAFTVTSFVQGVPLTGWDSPGWFALFLGNPPVALVNDWPRQAVLIVLWSLQVEEQFYLLYPALVKACRPARLRLVLMACVAIAPLLRTVMTLIWPDRWFACYVLMPCRMDALAIGGLIALSARTGTLPLARRTAPLALAGIAVTAAMLVWRGPWMGDVVTRSIGYTVIDMAAGLLLMVVLAAPHGLLSSILRYRPMVFVGQISFGLYLLHIPAAIAFRALVRPWWIVWPAGTTNMVTSFVVAFVVASLSWFTVERWGRRLRARMDDPSRAARVAAIDPAA